MREKPVAARKQYELIMECRSSGLSDAQWCLENGIKPGTFYSWVSKLKKKACYDIPEPNGRIISVPKQDVVRIDPMPDTCLEKISSGMMENGYVMEILCGTKTIRIKNGTDPRLLSVILDHEGRLSC